MESLADAGGFLLVVLIFIYAIYKTFTKNPLDDD